MENSKFKYKFFSLYLPSLLAIISQSFSGLSLTGQTRQEKLSKGVYVLKLDFSNINFTAIVHPTNATINGLSSPQFYYFGLWNHCDTRSFASTNSFSHCSSKEAGYRYDLYDIVESEGFNYEARKNIDHLVLPNGINPSKEHVDLIFTAVCIANVALTISTILLIGYVTFGKDKPNVVIGGIIFTATVFLGISVVSAQRTYSKIINSFTNSYDEFGIHASFGNRMFYSFLWCAFSFQLLSLIMIIISNYFLSEAEKFDRVVNDEPDPEIITPRIRFPTISAAFITANFFLPLRTPVVPVLPAVNTQDFPPKYDEINNNRAPEAPAPAFVDLVPERAYTRTAQQVNVLWYQ